MWHEARKHEKKLRVMIVDYRKRAERRREFYEKFKADPTQFMQVHGRPIKIYMDPQITAAAEKCLMPWPGNPETTIDRFDVRAHLDQIPDSHNSSKDDSKEKEEPGLNYERYRILIQNDLAGISEDRFLHQIHIEEQYGTTVPLSTNKVDKPKQPKAAIAYTYADDNKPNASSASNILPKSSATADIAAAAEEDSDEDLDFDLLVNVNDMTAAQKSDLNNSGVKYGLAPGDFMNFLNAEIQEKEELRLAKLQEEEKQTMSGRKARRERRAYKDRIIMRKGYISPPSYAATNSPESDNSHRSSSRSHSRSNSPEKIEYITSFGEGDANENMNVINTPDFIPTMVGPNLPSIPSRMKRSRSKSGTPDRPKTSSRYKSSNSGNGRSRSRKSPQMSFGSSSSSSRSRSSSRNSKNKTVKRVRRSRSLSSSSSDPDSDERRRRRSKRKRSSSSSGSERRHRLDRRNSRSTNSSRSYADRRPRRRSRSRSSRSRSRTPPRRLPNDLHKQSQAVGKTSRDVVRTSGSTRRSMSRSPSTSSSSSDACRSPRRTRDSRDAREGSCSLKSDTKSGSIKQSEKLPSPPVKRYYGRERNAKRDQKSSDSFSASDREEDKIQPRVTNNKLNNRTGDRSGHSSPMKSKPSVSTSAKTTILPDSSKSLKPHDKLKRRMQTALNKQLKADKEAQKSRIERQELERLEREESLRELSIKYRRRERERRHHHRGGRDSRSGSSNSRGSSPSGSNQSRSPVP